MAPTVAMTIVPALVATLTSSESARVVGNGGRDKVSDRARSLLGTCTIASQRRNRSTHGGRSSGGPPQERY